MSQKTINEVNINMKIQNSHMSIRPKNDFPLCVRCGKERENGSSYYCFCEKCGLLWSKKLHKVEKKLGSDCLFSTHPELWKKLNEEFRNKRLPHEKVEFT